jgi:hypothetical protein
MWDMISSFDADDWYLAYLVLMMIIAFIGGVWLFWSSYDHLGLVPALGLTIVHTLVFLQTTVPLIFFLYAIYYLVGVWLTHRRLKTDDAPRFGITQEVDPVKEAKKLGLPSVRPGAAPEEGIARWEEVAELERLLVAGEAARALERARELLAEAESDGRMESAGIYRKHIRRIERGEY